MVLDEPEAAAATAREALDLAREHPDAEDWEPLLLAVRALALQHAGEHEEARRHADAARAPPIAPRHAESVAALLQRYENSDS